MKWEMEKMQLTVSFLSNRWSYGVVLYEISTIGKSVVIQFDKSKMSCCKTVFKKERNRSTMSLM